MPTACFWLAAAGIDGAGDGGGGGMAGPMCVVAYIIFGECMRGDRTKAEKRRGWVSSFVFGQTAA